MTVHNKKTLIFSLLTVFFVSGFTFSNAAEAKFKYRKAIDAGKQHCSKQYPGNKQYEQGRFNLLKGGCWSCPRGFERTAEPAPDKHKSCKKPRPYTAAKFHSHASGVMKNVCKGTPWLKDKKCWTCPKGFKRSLEMVGSKPQCKPETKNFYHPATLRGNAGCPAGTWSPSLNGNCYTCPSGYFRNPLRTSRDRAKDDHACMTYYKSKKDQAAFINKYKRQAEIELNRHPDLIAQAHEFQKKISRTIKRKGGISKLTKADIRQAGGQTLAVASCSKGYPSITVTGGGDVSYIGGINGSAGLAFGLKAECDGTQDGDDTIDKNTDFGVAWLATANVTGGASWGADGGINIGFWRVDYDNLYGFAHGIVGGGAIQVVGVNGSAWWTIDWGPGKGEFAGISVGWQGGLSGELEYNWGYTWQMGTFGCRGVKIEATNNTGKRIKVIDIDYHDYGEGKWYSEPTKNEEVASGGVFKRKRNLEKVDGEKAQIRIKYRIQKSNGGWGTVVRAWSSSDVCEHGKTYTVNLKNK